MTPHEELQQLLRPAGGGVYLVSTGKAEQIALQKTIYEANDEGAIALAHQRSLHEIASAKAVLLGVPSDVGAGFLRGANMGPMELRLEFLRRHASWFRELRQRGVVDIGDVFVVPQLLRDEMLSSDQKRSSQDELYPQVNEALRRSMPVSPLSIERRVIELVRQLNAGARFVLLGGDHSTAWPLADVLAKSEPDLGIVQVDAHTDMLEKRLGIEICFATWSFHASRALASPARLAQFGIRATRFEKEHWEGKYGIRQYWARECSSTSVIHEALNALEKEGVRKVYFSNDIDGTDARFADATGTPEPDGLTPSFVLELIEQLGRRFEIIASDVMEVAPPIARTPGGRERTLALATDYIEHTLRAMHL